MDFARNNDFDNCYSGKKSFRRGKELSRIADETRVIRIHLTPFSFSPLHNFDYGEGLGRGKIKTLKKVSPQGLTFLFLYDTMVLSKYIP